MDKKEFSVLAMAIKTYYPRENILPNSAAMELWFTQLNDIPYKAAEVFLRKWVSTEKFPPTIAEIRKGVLELTAEPIPDWSEAWKDVYKAVGRFGLYQEERALDSLPKLAREVIKRLGWKNLCMSDNETAFRANFRDCYERLAVREKQSLQLPQNLKNQIAELSNVLMLGEEKNKLESK